jgi:hypothetical protein
VSAGFRLRAPGFGLLLLGFTACHTRTHEEQAGAVADAALFEGVVTLHARDARAHLDQDFRYTVKGALVRIDTAAPGRPIQHAVLDRANHMMITVIDDTHSFAAAPVRIAGAGEGWQVKRVGDEERVAGHACVDWEARLGKRVVSICATTLERFFDLGALGTSAAVPQPWLASIDGFPLRTIEKDESGTEVARVELVAAAAQPIDDALLVTPKGYRQVQTSDPTVSAGHVLK